MLVEEVVAERIVCEAECEGVRTVGVVMLKICVD